MRRILVGLALGMIALSGCVTEAPGTFPTEAPDGAAAVDADAFDVAWREGPTDPPRSKTWPLTDAWYDGGTRLLYASGQDQTIEGHDHRLRVYVGLDEPPERTYSYAGSRPGPGADTFSFEYDEAPFWAGRNICRVDGLVGETWLRIDSWDEATRRLDATLRLDFLGSCPGGRDGGDTGPHRTLIEGGLA